MIFFEYEQVVKIHRSLIEKTGGMDGIRDAQLLDSALKTPFQTFGGNNLYPNILDKASQLCNSLIENKSLYLCIIICHSKKFKADTGSRSVRFNSLLALKNCTISYNSENSKFIPSIVCLKTVGFPTYTIKHKPKKTSRCFSILFKVACSETEVSEQVYSNINR